MNTGLFEWKNGTKTQNAVVTSDGVTVQDAVYEGETPLSASNLNKAQAMIKETIDKEIGDLTTLGTTNKSNLVNAVNEVITYLKATVLYDNNNGSSGDITLSDTVRNYDFIDIFYRSNDGAGFENCTRVKGKMDTQPFLQYIFLFSGQIIFKIKNVNVKENKITNIDDKYTDTALVSGQPVNVVSNNHIFITKVVGYKYM